VPPLVGGQVKTFHPAVYAGILARRDVADQLDELEANSIGLIDIVVVNVAPFARPSAPGSSASTRRSR
jgi:phosphoribosylaminoimidazolecarboxamide formyltransferase/IMP cyclohydrolase